MALRLRDVLLPFQIARRLVVATYRQGSSLVRMTYVAIGIVCDAILRAFLRGKSQCKFAVFALRAAVLIAYRVALVVIVLCYFIISNKLKAGFSRLVMRMAVRLARPHHYQPLDHPDTEIRLFRVRSCANVWGIPGTMLVKADLVSVPMANAPPFAAVSYRWTYSKTVPSLIGRGRFAMSTSIYELLCSIQSDPAHSQGEQLFWIDSICINQADINEKASQIGLMRDIYRSASCVIAWLGSNAPAANNWQGLDGAREAALLVSNDFFFRVWIIQEMTLASRLVLRTKYDTCSWNEGVIHHTKQLAPAFSLYGENQMRIPAHMMTRMRQGIDNIKGFDSFRELLDKSPSGIPLNELLVRSAEFDCTDPRDRIFGLLGLSTDAARSAIHVNYNDSYCEIDACVEAVRFGIWHESSFQLLELSGIGLIAAHGLWDERPSWIPVWDAAHISKEKDHIMHSKSHQTATHLPFNIEVMDDGIYSDRLLRIEGVVVDSVRDIMTPRWHIPLLSTVSDEKIRIQVSQFLDQIDMVCKIARGDESPPPGVIDPRRAIIRTIKRSGFKEYEEKAEEPTIEQALDYLETASERLRGRIDTPEYWNQLHHSTTHMDYMHFILYLEQAVPLMIGRRLCTTERGRFAMVPAFTEVGDNICSFSGAPNPFLLRQCQGQAATSKDGQKIYQLVGAAYVDGIMEGELESVDLSIEMFHIK